MKNNRNLNMTGGSPALLLATFALPMLIGNLFQQAYNLVDSIIVGRFVGADAFAAVGTTGSVTFLFFSVCSGIGSGCSVVASQYFGSGDAGRTKRAIANAAYLMFLTALVMGVAAFLAAPGLLGAMDTPAALLPDAVTYMRMSCVGVPLIAVYNYASSMLRALGDSRTPLVFLVLACLLNAALDVLFVCVFHMGVAGAALATIIAQMLSGIGCLVYALRSNPYFMLSREDRKLDLPIIGHSVRLGIPMAMQWSLIAVSTTWLQVFVNSFGPSAMAAFTATNRIEQLLQQPYGSMSAALATYAGQNYGAGNLRRVREGFRHGMAMSAAFTLVMVVVMQLLGDRIIAIFVDEPEVIRIGGVALRLTSWFYIFLAIIYMTRGILNGIGDALFAFINGVVEVACRISLPAALVLLPTMGMWGIWWTVGLTWMISALFCLLRYAAWRRRTGKALAAQEGQPA